MLNRIIVVALCLVPALAVAHPGHESLSETGFLAGMGHAFQSLTHLAPPLLLALLLGQLGGTRRRRLLTGAGFAALAGLTGFAHVMWSVAGAGFLCASALLLGLGAVASALPRVRTAPAALASVTGLLLLAAPLAF